MFARHTPHTTLHAFALCSLVGTPLPDADRCWHFPRAFLFFSAFFFSIKVHADAARRAAARRGPHRAGGRAARDERHARRGPHRAHREDRHVRSIHSTFHVSTFSSFPSRTRLTRRNVPSAHALSNDLTPSTSRSASICFFFRLYSCQARSSSTRRAVRVLMGTTSSWPR